jgi:hypothetical protein
MKRTVFRYVSVVRVRQSVRNAYIIGRYKAVFKPRPHNGQGYFMSLMLMTGAEARYLIPSWLTTRLTALLASHLHVPWSSDSLANWKRDHCRI